jgi:cytochrome c oxidase subunit 2
MVLLLPAEQSAVDPAGPQATLIHSLWSMMLVTLSTVSLVVMVFLIIAAFGSRHGHPQTDGAPLVPVDTRQERRFSIAVLAGVIATVVVLFVLLFSSFQTGRALYAISRTEQALVITVTGHQWWWNVVYDDPIPSRRLTTANEIHLPVGRVVQFHLRSSDVIHSFWVPNLQGKTDLIPGHESTTWLRADRAGVYRGQCAEFCGHQHANMAFTVVVESPEQFYSWYESQLNAAAEPVTPEQVRGREVFLSSACVLCHRIGGTDAGATRGPDLTHIASRATLAAGTLENTRDHLGAWIVDSQSIKPGNNMPPNVLKPEDLKALLDYLETLK